MNKPCVYIVGAGPGDPSLISVRGRRYLERADVVVHDHRVSAATLRLSRPDAEKIDVGPAAPRTLDQEAISILLAEKVREGKSVVRLKLGDPFVFDSGGKEALLLHEQGIAYDIVPGIPTVIAGMAYAGIPVTYPGAGDVVTLIRGNEGETDAAPDVDWARLAGMGGPSRATRARGRSPLLRARWWRTAVPRRNRAHSCIGRRQPRKEQSPAHWATLRRKRWKESRRCWSSERWSVFGSTCAGSTIVHSSAAGSS